MRFLVTAGNTREKIDRVRDWGNIFTGNTGYAIACELAKVGEVDLLTSNRAHLAAQEESILGTPFLSHSDLRAELERALRQNTYDAIFMTAAVADYRPTGSFEVVRRQTSAGGEETWTVRDVHAGKVKSSYQEIAFLGQRTEKLIDQFRTTWGYQGLLVKFKLEVDITAEQLIAIGQQSRRASGADYLVANTLDMVEGERAGAYLLSERGEEWVSRTELPARLVQIVKRHRE